MRSRAPIPASWPKLLSSPDLGWPWPYETSEFAAIQASLRSAPRANAALKNVVAEARLFLCPPAAAERAVHIRPNPRTQVQRVAAAVAELKSALEALDYEALRHLSSCANLPDEGPLHLQTAVYAFEYNRGLVDLPMADVIGRKPYAHINHLQSRLRAIWVFAHDKPRPPIRGWPAFCDACLDPIDPHPPAEKKSRQDQLLSAKRREKSPKKR